jgi:toxin ParE1/3/4
MSRIRVAGPAEQDLDDIWYYTAKKSGSMDIANRLVDSISKAFPLLARVPVAGARRDEIEPGLRGFPVGNYIVYYRKIGDRVVSSRVIHGMRDQKTVLANE